MSLNVELLSRARQDRDQIWADTVDRWGIDQAVAYLEGLDAILKLLSDFPEMARKHTVFTPPVRIHPYRSHLIVYRTDETSLQVVRLLHGRSSWQAILSE